MLASPLTWMLLFVCIACLSIAGRGLVMRPTPDPEGGPVRAMTERGLHGNGP